MVFFKKTYFHLIFMAVSDILVFDRHPLHFWKHSFYLEKARVQKIRHAIRRASDSHIFLMTVSEREKIEAIACCKKYAFCPIPYVISPASDNTVFYETLYRILNRKLEVFSSDLELRTSTRQIHAIKCELHSLIEKLQSRNTSVKSPLTEQCLEILQKYVFYDCLNIKTIFFILFFLMVCFLMFFDVLQIE